MTDKIVQSLIDALGADIVLTGDATARYCRDWHGDAQGAALAVLRPRDTEGVSLAMNTCARLGLGVIPQGGNTGLALGAVAEAGGNVVLSLERMSRIRRIDPGDFSAVVEAGCVLADFKEKLAAEGMFFALALGAQGSCQIGGNVATNAGGINVLRYGMTREQVLGLEVVLPGGEVLDLLSTLRKDNRGIDLKQLFIGSEGTLGIITAVAVRLSPRPAQVATALLALRSLDEVIALYRRARLDCCDLLSAFEFMPPMAFTLAHEAMPELALPMEASHPAYALIEISGSGLVDIDDLMARFLEGVMGEGLVIDGVLAASEAQARNLWLFREGMNEGQARRGVHLRTDMSVPISAMAAFVARAEAAAEGAAPGALVVSYGHVGDGNVHLNVIPRPEITGTARLAEIKAAKAAVYAVLDEFGGSISAEHGIGRAKRDDFTARLDPARARLLGAIKDLIDPAGRMNPGCMLPAPDRPSQLVKISS
ncbi:MAG: FAD-binding oxidoreductase [Paracoccus sp. (in: a-proteobacteria)]|nr:FAD-binding oxidoreductase [Paracoccus sp. (in: a-proteobacteria)]